MSCCGKPQQFPWFGPAVRSPLLGAGTGQFRSLVPPNFPALPLLARGRSMASALGAVTGQRIPGPEFGTAPLPTDANSLYQALQLAIQRGLPQATIDNLTRRLREASAREGLPAPSAPLQGPPPPDYAAVLASFRETLRRLEQEQDPSAIDLAYNLSSRLWERGYQDESRVLREAADRVRLRQAQPAPPPATPGPPLGTRGQLPPAVVERFLRVRNPSYPATAVEIQALIREIQSYGRPGADFSSEIGVLLQRLRDVGGALAATPTRPPPDPLSYADLPPGGPKTGQSFFRTYGRGADPRAARSVEYCIAPEGCAALASTGARAGTIPVGAAVMVLERRGGLTRVRSSELEGWVPAASLGAAPPAGGFIQNYPYSSATPPAASSSDPSMPVTVRCNRAECTAYAPDFSPRDALAYDTRVTYTPDKAALGPNGEEHLVPGGDGNMKMVFGTLEDGQGVWVNPQDLTSLAATTTGQILPSPRTGQLGSSVLRRLLDAGTIAAAWADPSALERVITALRQIDAGLARAVNAQQARAELRDVLDSVQARIAQLRGAAGPSTGQRSQPFQAAPGARFTCTAPRGCKILPLFMIDPAQTKRWSNTELEDLSRLIGPGAALEVIGRSVEVDRVGGRWQKGVFIPTKVDGRDVTHFIPYPPAGFTNPRTFVMVRHTYPDGSHYDGWLEDYHFAPSGPAVPGAQTGRLGWPFTAYVRGT